MTKGAEMRKTATALVALALGLVSTIAASATIGVDLPTFPKNYYATWSPDGKRIAFTSDRRGSVDIFVMNADGTQQRPLLRTRDAEWWPAWSPDGKRLAFVSDRDGPYAQIYSLDLATGRQIRLTYADASDYQPAWSRDGRIAFRRRVYAEATDDMTSQIYVMNADGTGIHPMRADADYHLSPAARSFTTRRIGICGSSCRTGRSRLPTRSIHRTAATLRSRLRRSPLCARHRSGIATATRTRRSPSTSSTGRCGGSSKRAGRSATPRRTRSRGSRRALTRT